MCNHSLNKMYTIHEMHNTMIRIYAAAKAKFGNAEQSFVATKMGESPQTLNNWESRGASKRGILVAARVFDADAAYLETGEEAEIPLFLRSKQAGKEVDLDDSHDFIKIKRVDFKISAGISGYSVEYLDGDKAPIFFRRDWIESKGFNHEHLYAIKVSGHSMETSLYEGDLVVVNVDDTKPIDGEVFSVNYEGELVIKRMVRQSGNWYLASDNSDKRKYSDKLCHENCIVIGRVIYKQSERI